ncbi:D-glycero-beta-D-manno-heptose 1-phosphate adenylyltransferase [Dactylosporangium aurantiacum]|uniref:D-glycero-beta-D-manno-heptose 1-phosphate adenylyltransferase n=1 Tax=Dactylosporangium aurantiacum TaxID=35754 RepID=A0A9Q9IT87_9ACTN|nr:D-glycero-beta-D-manno-heptose 1-phosphate adenylyltransferase [Dactylosporangium aurantiacum]MDG6103799.1 D-glycero-beta-D-manno-heptose 1-phosphate adenylyltransferase [Dactylosporangium aurantiacum]UWZ58995.1 D-glycero-beta-D-manno-heptose 1-phosphate adenylyltransferase [Dactylosporangium aurantiacum]
MNELLVVVGDTLLDRDVDGTVARVCPDAPAPVLDEHTATERPGGAGLAALLAARAGHRVALVTAIAEDAAGARLCALLAAAGVTVYAMDLPGATPQKMRLRAHGQVLLRLDRGGPQQDPGEPPAATLAVLADAAAILVSDYGRGVTRQPAVRAALAAAAAPIVWDPHPNGAAPVHGARLTTPNLAEVRALSGDAGNGTRLSTAVRGGRALRDRWRSAAIAVTMGADGAVLCQSGPTPLVVPPPAAAGGDTCGAGDRFAATAALALARGALVSEAVQEAVAEATAYVAAGGVTTALAAPAATPAGDPAGVAAQPSASAVPVGPREAGRIIADVRARGGTVVATGGCFDLLHAGHVATLEAARRLGDCLVVCLNSDAGVRALKGPDRPLNPQDDRARLLAALGCVDAVVVFDEPTPATLLTWLRPDIWVKGGDYADGGPDLPESEVVQRYGGQTVIVPYLAGRSTTRLITTAQTRRSKEHV